MLLPGRADDLDGVALRYFWPAGGWVEITRPEAIVLLFWGTFFTLKLVEFKVVAAVPQDLPTSPVGYRPSWRAGAHIESDRVVRWHRRAGAGSGADDLAVGHQTARAVLDGRA